jgi:hypothetical protein
MKGTHTEACASLQTAIQFEGSIKFAYTGQGNAHLSQIGMSGIGIALSVKNEGLYAESLKILEIFLLKFDAV